MTEAERHREEVKNSEGFVQSNRPSFLSPFFELFSRK